VILRKPRKRCRQDRSATTTGDQIIGFVESTVVPLEEPIEGVLHDGEVDRKEGPRDVE